MFKHAVRQLIYTYRFRSYRCYIGYAGISTIYVKWYNYELEHVSAALTYNRNIGDNVNVSGKLAATSRILRPLGGAHNCIYMARLILLSYSNHVMVIMYNYM